jgi:hypothetical protein
MRAFALLDPTRMKAGWLIGLLVSGCATSDLMDEGQAQANATAGAVAVLGSGNWYRSVGCPSPDPATCLTEARFWIDLDVRNDAYDKQVAVVWIDRVREDAAGAWHLANAVYEGTRPDGRETWGVDVTVRVISGIEPKPQIRFAASATMAGETFWDNNFGADHVIE